MTAPEQSHPPAPTRIAHIGIALPSIQQLLPFLTDVLNLPDVEIADSDGATIAAVDAQGTLIELLEPAVPDSPIGRFIARRGAGIHHICLAVDDLDGMLSRCRDAGVELIDSTPRMGAEGKRIAFLHPRSTGGILIELSE